MNKGANIISIIAVAVSIIIILGVLAATYLETFQRTKKVNPSRETKENVYLAFDRWLLATGHPVRILENANVEHLNEAGENVILIFTSSFNFPVYDEFDEFNALFYKGKNIVIFNDVNNEDFDLFLDDIMSDDYDDIDGDNKQQKDIFDDFDIDIIELENGKLYVSDSYYFMKTGAVEQKSNAGISWALSGDLDSQNTGILIVRSAGVSAGKTPKDKDDGKSFWGAAKEKGALFPMLVSTAALVIFGFWMCFITFGRGKQADRIDGKTINERFLAEGRFLKKNKALNVYLKYFKGGKPEDNFNNANVTVNDIKQLLTKEKESVAKVKKAHEGKI